MVHIFNTLNDRKVDTVKPKTKTPPSEKPKARTSRFKVYDMSKDTSVSENSNIKEPKRLRDALNTLFTVTDDAEQLQVTLQVLPKLFEKEPHEVASLSDDLLHRFVSLENKYDLE